MPTTSRFHCADPLPLSDRHTVSLPTSWTPPPGSLKKFLKPHPVGHISRQSLSHFALVVLSFHFRPAPPHSHWWAATLCPVEDGAVAGAFVDRAFVRWCLLPDKHCFKPRNSFYVTGLGESSQALKFWILSKTVSSVLFCFFCKWIFCLPFEFFFDIVSIRWLIIIIIFHFIVFSIIHIFIGIFWYLPGKEHKTLIFLFNT